MQGPCLESVFLGGKPALAGTSAFEHVQHEFTEQHILETD